MLPQIMAFINHMSKFEKNYSKKKINIFYFETMKFHEKNRSPKKLIKLKTSKK